MVTLAAKLSEPLARGNHATPGGMSEERAKSQRVFRLETFYVRLFGD